MTELDRFVADNLGLTFLSVAVLVALLLTGVVVQSLRLARALRAYRSLVRDASGGSLADALDAHVGRVERVDARLAELEGIHAALESRSAGSLQHVGLVRFNPFDDTGSDQSFVIALLNDRRDGIVLSSLHGRSGTRIFAKPVARGASPHALSDEEMRAIEIAMRATG